MTHTTEQLEAMLAAATPGPWEYSHRAAGSGYSTQVYPADDPDNSISMLHWHSVKTANGFTTDREFNAALFTAAPTITAELIAARRKLEAAEGLSMAAQGLGAMPEGYCFCSAHRIGDDSKTHEPECADLRAALAAWEAAQ